MSQFTYPGPEDKSDQQPPNQRASAPQPPPYSPQYVSQSPNQRASAPQLQIQQPGQLIQPVYQAVQQQQPPPVAYVQQIQPPQNVAVQYQIPQSGSNVQYQVVQPAQPGFVNANVAAYPAQMQAIQQVQPQRISLQVVDQGSNNQHLQQYQYGSNPAQSQSLPPANSLFCLQALRALSCLSCILCCPCGSISLYCAFKASDQYRKKNFVQYERAKRNSMIFAAIALVLFALIVASS